MLRIKQKKSAQGFTLVEVLMAMVILMFGLLAVGSMQIMAMRGNTHSKHTTERTVTADNFMEWLTGFTITHNNLRTVEAPDSVSLHSVVVKDDGTFEIKDGSGTVVTDETEPPAGIVPGSVSKIEWVVNVETWEDGSGGTVNTYDTNDTITSKRITVTVYWSGGGETQLINIKPSI